MDSTLLMVLAFVGLGALLLVLFGVRRRGPLNTDEVIERMGRFATREDFLSISDSADGKHQPNQVALSLLHELVQYPARHLQPVARLEVSRLHAAGDVECDHDIARAQLDLADVVSQLGTGPCHDQERDSGQA